MDWKAKFLTTLLDESFLNGSQCMQIPGKFLYVAWVFSLGHAWKIPEVYMSLEIWSLCMDANFGFSGQGQQECWMKFN